MKSLLQDIKKCYVCDTTLNLHQHHIFEGRNRKNSDKYGCWVWLCARHHNMSDAGVHFNKRLDNELKQQCQLYFQKKYPELDFLNIFKRNYL